MSNNDYISIKATINKNIHLVHVMYPQTLRAIDKAEETLNIKFPKSYKKFLIEYGTLDVGGRDIYGLDNQENYDEYVYFNIVCNTLDQRKVNTDPSFPESFVVIYDLGDGEKFCLDTSKMNSEGECPVVAWYFGRIEQVYEDFGAFFLETVTAGLKSLEERGNKINW